MEVVVEHQKLLAVAAIVEFVQTALGGVLLVDRCRSDYSKSHRLGSAV